MKSFTLNGKLENTYPEWPEVGPDIGGSSIVDHIEQTFGADYTGDLTVTFSVHTDETEERKLRERGAVKFYAGDQGISEVTDWTLDEITVGGIDLIARLGNYEDMIVTLRVDDGPQHDYSKLKSTHSGSLADNLGRQR